MPVLFLLSGPKMGFSSRRSDTLPREIRSPCQISLLSGQKCGNTAPKLVSGLRSRTRGPAYPHARANPNTIRYDDGGTDRLEILHDGRPIVAGQVFYQRRYISRKVQCFALRGSCNIANDPLSAMGSPAETPLTRTSNETCVHKNGDDLPVDNGGVERLP